jgi:uncharacterized membrane protein
MEQLTMVEIVPNWHPVFVHFPIALVLASVGLHLVAPWLPAHWREHALLVARWNLWLAAAAVVVTVATGWQAFNSVDHDDAGHAAMLEHRRWALITSAVVLVLAAWAAWPRVRQRATGLLFLGLLVVAGALMLTTAWHGGELVYRHGLGVRSFPVAPVPAAAPASAPAHDHSSHAH